MNNWHTATRAEANGLSAVAHDLGASTEELRVAAVLERDQRSIPTSPARARPCPTLSGRSAPSMSFSAWRAAR